MLEVSLIGGRLRIGERLFVSFHRTLRIPDDGRTYPLPPGLGLLPALPWRGPGDDPPEIIVPLWQREALWLGFAAAPWKPNAVKVIVGGINAVSGLPGEGVALGEPQDYLVAPDQPWLDGFNAGGGVIRQFVAMPLGQGYAIEAGAGRPEQGGIEVVGVEPLPGRFPDAPPPPRPGPMRLSRPAAPAGEEAREMALGAGGRMHQKIYPDRYGREVWDLANTGRARVRLLNSRRWRELTGGDPPPSPIDAAAYTAAGLPWFALYDEDEAAVAPDERRRVKSVAERDSELGAPTSEASLDVPVSQVTAIDRETGDNGKRGRRGRSDAASPPPAKPGKR